MRELHEKASLEIEQEDKRKKRRLAVTEASNSVTGEIGQGSSGSILPVPDGISLPAGPQS